MKTQIYREFTAAAAILGVLQGVVLTIAFTYITLKLGFSMGGSAIAAIFGYVFLRGVLGVGTSVENNLNQTVASSINTAGTGVAFIMPTLFLLQTQDPSFSFELTPLLVSSLAGAILGVVLIIPLRKQLIELDRLRFPTGTATATVIRSGSEGFSKAKYLFIGLVISAVWKGVLLTGVIAEEVSFGFGIVPLYFSPFIYLSLMNFAAGMLSGRGGLPFFWGGILGWWILSPLIVNFAPEALPTGLSDSDLMDFIYAEMLRPLGIGILIGAALMGVILAFPSMQAAIRALLSSTQIKSQRELPLWLLVVVVLLAFSALLWSLAQLTDFSLGYLAFVVMIAMIWAWVAGLIVAQSVGLSDITPLSGMTLVTVFLFMLLLDGHVAAAITLTMGVGIAITQGADMMQDLKTGFLVGSRPILQQIAQLSFAWIGVFISIGVLYVLWKAGAGGQGGFGADTALPAPIASTVTSLISSVQSDTMPVDKFIFGGIVGAILTLAPIAGLGVLIGLAMYLPFSITLGYGLGCLVGMRLEKAYGYVFIEKVVVPLSSGLIIGEALVGVGDAIYGVLS
ncbi:OPT/YSL family transporter [Candidatus Albibeggiatoa sp. nov. NOAA]|uniref:OPT/YSL family transporter n=1 Tax=Candidatus Albibeggiatoa sp. nov. NOAA TaxID=3162724 RepID=UPI0033040C54|nr:OPT/YSL family transporter [Thiotrichaceae bacterium]